MTYFGPSITKFRATKDSWFDEYTIVTLLDDYTDSGIICGLHNKRCGTGLFEGYKDGKLDEEVCSFCEFTPLPRYIESNEIDGYDPRMDDNFEEPSP